MQQNTKRHFSVFYWKMFGSLVLIPSLVFGFFLDSIETEARKNWHSRKIIQEDDGMSRNPIKLLITNTIIINQKFHWRIFSAKVTLGRMCSTWKIDVGSLEKLHHPPKEQRTQETVILKRSSCREPHNSESGWSLSSNKWSGHCCET